MKNIPQTSGSMLGKKLYIGYVFATADIETRSKH